MLRYEIIGNIALNIDLHNGYSVMAIAKWDRDTEKYITTLYLKNNKFNINHFDLIEDFENFELDSDIKTIKTDITAIVTELLSDGFFTKYIKRYEYEQKCFEIGNDSIENQEG
ncbi:hypothetical protein [uncultured Eubacterium sp.]|uniref:hypothetical protein n=1 Tax=uncultured Eubacterium sp. TaxID=165185 RepID=UPI002602D14D|nr:hypothetical protein [uncultured Eubacterium sp.]